MLQLHALTSQVNFIKTVDLLLVSHDPRLQEKTVLNQTPSSWQ